MTLSWPSKAGQTYQHWSEDLVIRHKLTPLPMAGTDTLLTIGDTQRPQHCFYRIAVVPAP